MADIDDIIGDFEESISIILQTLFPKHGYLKFLAELRPFCAVPDWLETENRISVSAPYTVSLVPIKSMSFGRTCCIPFSLTWELFLRSGILSAVVRGTSGGLDD